MIAKELRDAWWKIVIGAALILLPVVLLTPYDEAVELAENFSNPQYSSVTLDGEDADPRSAPSPPPEISAEETNLERQAISETWFVYVGGVWIMTFLAAIFGFNAMSEEESRGTLPLLLSRPVSRRRILLSKYGANALVLFIVAALGGVGLMISAGLKGYPLEEFNVVGLVLASSLLWLGTLFVLGLSTLSSVIFRDMIANAVIVPMTLLAIFFLPGILGEYYIQLIDGPFRSGTIRQLSEMLFIPLYWIDESLYLGESFAATNFLVCAVAALIPLLAALWLFNRKAY